MAEFTMLATEAIGSLLVLEAPHTSDPSLDPAMIPFDAVIQVGTGPMSHSSSRKTVEVTASECESRQQPLIGEHPNE
jgi:hypothetical protein